MNRGSSPLTITSSSPLEICNSANVTIEGTFDSTNTDATLFVTLGKYTSPNLVPLSAGGHFSHTIPISDKLGNWNEQNVIVEYTSEENGTEKVSIPLSVNKTCSAINMLPPNISVNVRQCKADVSINQTKGDNAIYSFYIDNNLKKEHYVDEKGNAKTDNCGNKEFTNDPLRVDTIVLAEAFKFPACNYDQQDIKVSVRLLCSITARQTSTYAREMYLDCIYLRPRRVNE